MKYETKRNIILMATILFSSIYLLWRLFFTLPFGAGVLQLLAGIWLLAAEIMTNLGTFELYWSKMKNAKSEIDPIDIPHEYYPDVDVFIATHNEPAELLYKTINACTFMEYPDKKKVHIYVCDDGNRPEIAELAKWFDVGYIDCPGNTHAKSGNYNHALSVTSSPLVATFDADMIPQRKFLMETVGYFFAQEWIEEDGVWRKRTEEEKKDIKKIGLVQTPQSFYNEDLFQFNLFMENQIPNEQDFFSREINVMRNASNSVAYTGSNTLILREAMDEIGGFPYKTITEDFETSLRMQMAGYITYATTEILAAGLSTTTVSSMIKQRVRWAQGVIQSIQNTNAIFTRKLPLRGRISYLNAYLYWWSFSARLIFILAPILFALFDFQLVTCSFFQLLLFWLPSYLLFNLASRYLSTNVRNLRWSQIIDTILFPYLVVPVFLESIGIHQRKFKVTKKEKEGTKTTNVRYMIPHGILIVLTVLAILRYLYGKYGMALVYSSVIIFWLFYNLIALIYAIFFMMGRESFRAHDRIKAEEKAMIRINGQKFRGQTIDVSEGGVAFWTEKEMPAEPGEACTLEIWTPYYHTHLNANIVYGRKKDDRYQYAVTVKPVDETDERQYLQIIHDRIHTLPQTLDKWMTPYDDLVKNAEIRLEKAAAERRKKAAQKGEKQA